MGTQQQLMWTLDELLGKMPRGINGRTAWREMLNLELLLLALTRCQDQAQLVAVTQRMAVRLQDARNHLDDVAPEARNPNEVARAIQETQRQQWYRPMFRHQTKEGRTDDREVLEDAWL